MADKLPDSMVEELRRSFEHVLAPEFASLQEEIKSLHGLIDQLDKVSSPLPEELVQARSYLKSLESKLNTVDNQITKIQKSLTESDQVTDLIKIGLRPALQQEVEKSPNLYGKIISPAISKAITDKIKNSRTEMIEALHPIIGQTIRSAIAEAFNDLRRRIDSSMNQSMNIEKLLKQARGRVRGVSESDQIIRDSLEYSVTHVFLIHRATGLLLAQVTNSVEKEDLDMISGMLTAIRDFARTTFGSEEGELEEIQLGTSHILIKSGSEAYIASVIEGVQPSGYGTLLQKIVYQINQNHSAELSQYQGEVKDSTEYQAELQPLLNPSPEEMDLASAPPPLNRKQKMGLGAAGLVFLLMIAMVIFACNFSLRLLPVAYPKPTETATPTVEPTVIPATPTFTLVPTMSPTPTIQPTQIPTQTPQPVVGVTTGNVYSRYEPLPVAKVNPVVVVINTTVEILAVQGKWVKISWDTDFGKQEGWIPQVYVGIPQELPPGIVTPAPTSIAE